MQDLECQEEINFSPEIKSTQGGSNQMDDAAALLLMLYSVWPEVLQKVLLILQCQPSVTRDDGVLSRARTFWSQAPQPTPFRQD